MKIFVYGTLRKGARAFDFYLAGDDTKHVGQTTIRGDLYDMGWYPGIINAGVPEAGTVVGDVFEVTQETLASLDSYEGYPYLYRRDEIMTDDGQIVQTYVFNDAEVAAARPLVPLGDWLNY